VLFLLVNIVGKKASEQRLMLQRRI